MAKKQRTKSGARKKASPAKSSTKRRATASRTRGRTARGRKSTTRRTAVKGATATREKKRTARQRSTKTRTKRAAAKTLRELFEAPERRALRTLSHSPEWPELLDQSRGKYEHGRFPRRRAELAEALLHRSALRRRNTGRSGDCGSQSPPCLS